MKQHTFSRIGLAALLCVALPISVAQAAGPELTPEIEVSGGTVIGVRDAGLAVFKGIPFAAPPVRELRWKPPAPVASWKTALLADRYAPMCVQPLRAKNSVFYQGEEPTSEDCLYLNVWSPDTRSEAKLPVMVFIYGGGWVVGSGSMPLYSGEHLARKGVVAVTFNYRLGALGFLAHPELTTESDRKASGNYGLMDMVAALTWVRDNIARFGGDPASVTVYGQSAGAAAISLLEASPLAKGLFQRAIGQSGGFALDGPPPPLAAAEKNGLALAEKLNAKSLQELRDKGPDAVIAAGVPVRPILDGYVLPKPPAEVYRAGEEMRIPVLVGSNSDEGTPYPVAMSAAAFAEDARKRYGERADALLKLYATSTEAEARASSYELHRDRLFASAVRTWAREQSRVAPTFSYYFSHRPPYVEGLAYQQQTPASALGAYHGAEMAYAYGTLDSLNWTRPVRTWTEADRKLSDLMSSYWVNFAKTGNPNGSGLPVWPAYDEGKEQVILLGDSVVAGDLPNKTKLDFFVTP
ncbi:carboxylesterase/lipase family protein [Bradyrhizobium liaoningense]|uniref:carboxylesterase/lipase family protein n=1 Tax=Bradyrhizobium liaoningense TaxID=43992 RepID=UPI001BA872F9|nr:carboxylesterase family protein [Bradyrhizobium liaoningense]MBR0716605.1 carboxylesterase family protein [Bradyrhizobium liaoningense]